MKIILTCGLIMLFVFVNINAQIYPVSLESRIINSSTIAIARLKSKHSYWDQNHHNIYTLNVMEAKAYLNGNNNQTEIAIITEGGIVENQAQLTCPETDIIPETDYILFLEAENHEVDDKRYRSSFPNTVQCRAVAPIQGALPFQDGKYHDVFDANPKSEAALLEQIERITGVRAYQPTGNHYLARQHDECINQNNERLTVVITSIEDGNAGSGPYFAGTIDTGKELIIHGSGFESTRGTGKVEFDNADDGGATFTPLPNTSDYISWSDTEIRVKVHENGGTGLIKVTANGGSSDTEPITIDWALNPANHIFYNWPSAWRNQIEFVDTNGNGGYTFHYSTVGGFSGNSDATAAFERALTTWRCDSGINFEISESNTSAGFADDNISAIMFASIGGALGTTTTRVHAIASEACDMVDTHWHVREIDFRFSSTTSWFYGDGSCTSSQYDFESVALHELGHAHDLGHVIDNTGLMHFSIGTCNNANNIRRTLSATDSEAAAYVMTYSTNTNCIESPSPMTPVPLESCSLLPVELIKFSGKPVDDAVILNWQTATETNNDFFTLERSFDGRNYETIAIVKGKGTTHQIQFYEFVDHSPALGVNYYRLKQTDFDGTFEIFDQIVAVDFVEGVKAEVRPNPVNQDYFQLVFNSSGGDDLVVEIYSVAGKLLYKEIFNTDKDLNYLDVALPGLSNGIYILKASQNNFVENIRFVKRP